MTVHLARRSVRGRPGRFAATALAVVVGTSFLSGVLVFTGTLQRSFDELFATAYERTDAFVRSANAVEGDFEDIRDLLPLSLVEQVAAIDGVAEANASVRGEIKIARLDGTPLIERGGPPDTGTAFDTGATSSWQIHRGRAPSSDGELVLDQRSARLGSIAVGDQVLVDNGVRSQSFLVVGIVTFGGAQTAGGSAWAMFDRPAASSFVLGDVGLISGVSVRGHGDVSDAGLAAAIERELGRMAEPGSVAVEVLTGSEITADAQSTVQRGLRFFTTFLTAFALIALFVSAFVIYNVFSIGQIQRLREHALLRLVGATRPQLVRSLLAESMIVGLVGSAIGFVAGIGLAAGIVRLLPRFGVDLLDIDLLVEASSAVTVVVVGSVVTVLCALAPAVRASRTPPIAALSDVTAEPKNTSPARTIAAGVSSIGSIGATAVLLRGPSGWLLGVAVALIYLTVILSGPWIAQRAARTATRIAARSHGRAQIARSMAARNATRSPQRTAVTASALLIGLSLMVAISTMAASIRQSVADTVTSGLRGDFVVSVLRRGSGDFGTIPTSLAPTIDALPEIETAAGIGAVFVPIESGRDPGVFQAHTLLTVDPTVFGSVVDLQFVEGGLDELTAASMLVSDEVAKRNQFTLGETVTVRLYDATLLHLRIVGVFANDMFGGGYAVDRSLIESHEVPTADARIFINVADGVSADEARRALVPVIATAVQGSSGLTLLTPDEFVARRTASLDGFLNFTYALLALSIFVAALGIAITLTLSIHERRREIAMLRAVGMSQAAVRSTIRWESVLIALLGAVQGVVVGVTIGWLAVRSMRDEGLSSFDISWSATAAFVGVATLIGVIAAWWPARRAARSDILTALAPGGRR